VADATQGDGEIDDLFVRWSTASLVHPQTSSSGSLANSSPMTQKHTSPPMDKGRRRIMRFLSIGGGIAVGFLGVGGIDVARTMLQPDSHNKCQACR
jgi:hypothetical protein